MENIVFKPREISTKKWIFFFLTFILSVGLLIFFSERVVYLSRLHKLAIFLIYMSLAFTFCPLPIIWITLWVARDFNPFLVALVGACGTCLANLNDYYIFNFLYRYEGVQKIKDTQVYKKAIQWFNRSPFLALSAANFLPIPIDFIRLLAISTGYRRRYFILSTFVGRFPRYLIIAYLGYEFKLSNLAILIVLVVTVVIALIKTAPKLNWPRKKEDTEQK